MLFWCQLLTLVCSIGATYASSYAGFTACRTLQGFFGAPPQVIGLSMIHDLFFFHERARKINIWAFTFLIGPYLGPFISAFLVEKIAWRLVFGVLCGFYGLSVLLIVLFGDETLYNRDGPRKEREGGIKGRIMLLTGIQGVREYEGRPAVTEVTASLFSLLLRPYLLVPSKFPLYSMNSAYDAAFGFVTWITMWTIGIVSTSTQFVKPPPYLFSDTAVALLYFAPMIGTVLAEVWGHWFNDFLCTSYIRTHGGRYKPENRLWGVYPAWIIGIAGLVLFGQALQHHLPWYAIAIGWAMNCFSTLGTTTAVSAYLLDVLPQHAALASAWINAFRTVGTFFGLFRGLSNVRRWLYRGVLPGQMGDDERSGRHFRLPGSCCRLLHHLDYCDPDQRIQLATELPAATDWQNKLGNKVVCHYRPIPETC